MRLRKSTIGLAAIVILFGLLGVYNYVVQPMLLKKFILGAEPPPAIISAEAARTETWSDRITAVGSIEAVNGVDVTTEQAGVVREIAFQSGQTVRKGDVLVRLDSSTEEADVRLYEATLKNAQQDYERIKALVATQTASKAALDRALAARDQAAAQLARAKASLSKKVVRAPFSGRLGIRKVDLGQYINPGNPIVTLQAVDPIYATFPVPEQALNRIKTGQIVSVAVDTAPGRTFQGKITSIDARVDDATRNVTVQATLPNPSGVLTPGAFANVEITGSSKTDVVTVPATAVSYSLYGDTVFVLKPVKAAAQPGAAQAAAPQAKTDEQVFAVERRTVKVGRSVNGRVAISQGLQPGDLVATAGQLKLRDGGKAVINNSIALDPAAKPLPRE